MQYKTLRLLNVKTFLLYMLFSLLYMVPSSSYGLQFQDGSCFWTRYFHLYMSRFHLYMWRLHLYLWRLHLYMRRFHLYMWRFHFYMWRFFLLYRKTQTHHMQRTKHHIEWNKDTIYCGILCIRQFHIYGGNFQERNYMHIRDSNLLNKKNVKKNWVVFLLKHYHIYIPANNTSLLRFFGWLLLID